MSIIRDPSLAEAGIKKIEWVKNFMPVLSQIEKEFIKEKPFLGVGNPQDIDAEMARMFNLPSPGVLIRTVEEGSAADKAGVQPMDIIVSFNGTDVQAFNDLAALVGETKVGDTVEMSVYRGEERLDLTLVVGNRNEMP